MIDSTAIAQKVLSIVDQMHELRRPRIVPSEGALRRILEDVFWSSVDQYEGNQIRARLFFAPRAALTGSGGIIRLAARHPISRDAIRRLSPAHSADGGLLVVEDAPDRVGIEGILGSFPSVVGASPLWLRVESRGPGTVRVSNGFEQILDVGPRGIKQLGGMSFNRTVAEVFLKSAGLFPTEPATLDWKVASALLDIGFAIEQHGTGGALWILPRGSSIGGELEGLGERIAMRAEWWEPYREMWEMRTSVVRLLNPGCGQNHEFLQQAAQEWDLLRRRALTTSISSLAKVDGAIVINGSPDVLAFGVICNKFREPATQVLRSTNPSRPYSGDAVDASEFGGSRHRSAIDFCSSFFPAGAVVASHDGGLTVFVSLEKGRVIGSQVSLMSFVTEVK
ncbi:MAG: putative sensor domain DACNV-containing protein [Burkholderiales bacterium]